MHLRHVLTLLAGRAAAYSSRPRVADPVLAADPVLTVHLVAHTHDDVGWLVRRRV